MRSYWYRPGYWRWFWLERVGPQTKLALVVLLALGLGIAGYVGARGLGESDEAAALTTERVVTVVHKAGAHGTKLVTTYRTVTAKGKTVTETTQGRIVTVRRNGRTIVVRNPAERITVRGPVQQRVVTVPRGSTVLRTVTADRPTTVTAPGATVTTPGTTVTTSGPTLTTTRTVTDPPRTVTETTTDVQTITDTVTVTVTQPKSGPGPG